MRRQALAESLSDKAQKGKIVVIESLKFESPKTKQAVALLKTLGLKDQKCLIVTDQLHEATLKSFRNLPRTKVLPKTNLNTYEVLNHDVVVLTQGTLKGFMEGKKS